MLNGIKDNYPGLPEELKKFNYYFRDAGHSIMAIPKSLLEEAIEDGDLDGYECPMPCKYVLENGYEMHEGHVVCECVYDNELGLVVDDKWTEF